MQIGLLGFPLIEKSNKFVCSHVKFRLKDSVVFSSQPIYESGVKRVSVERLLRSTLLGKVLLCTPKSTVIRCFYGKELVNQLT